MPANRVRTAVLIGTLGLVLTACGGSPDAPAPVCTTTISPSSISFGSQGGSGAVTVTAPAGCSWIVASSSSWITVTGSASGSGPGTVTYSVVANTSTDMRNGGLTIGGQSHSISQQGVSALNCSYALSPGSAVFGIDSASGTFTLTAPAGCSWTANSDASWLLITSEAHGSGSATVAYLVSRNNDIPERSASITVADRTFSVRQSGDVSRCEYAVAPVEFNPCMPAGTATFSLTTQAACPWTATPNASWLALPGGESGSGPAAITITFPENYDAPRDGLVMVRWPTPTAGQNIRLAQAGCTYAVSRTDFSIGAGGASATFDVLQQSVPTGCGSATQDRCLWLASSGVNWITITTPMPQRGDQPVAFNVAANDATQSRTGQITVRDRIVTIPQAGR